MATSKKKAAGKGDQKPSGGGKPADPAPAASQDNSKLDALEGQITALERLVPGLQNRLGIIEGKVGRLDMNVPRTAGRSLTEAEAEAMIKKDPHQEFIVLDIYKRMGFNFAKGRTIRASHFKFLSQHIRTGLQVVPKVD